MNGESECMYVFFFRRESFGKVSGCHAEQTQALRQPQHLDHGNEGAQHLESVSHTINAFPCLYSTNKTVTL